MMDSGVSISRRTKKNQIVYSSRDFEKTGLTSVFENISERVSEEALPTEAPSPAFGPTMDKSPQKLKKAKTLNKREQKRYNRLALK